MHDNPITRSELFRISRPSKAFLKNKLTILRGNEELTAGDDRSSVGARQRARTNVRVIDDICAILDGTAEPLNAHPGRQYDAHLGGEEKR